MSTIRRLVLCLDGTWNNQDSSTNVLHHYGLVREFTDRPIGPDTVTQRTFYHEGVGTGPLDRITGGGFGFGLETNVRAAYDWLVQNFDEADDVYVFGFSRGAHTARSLVGFISTCGLLRRGAPLTVAELWENYCLLGRVREERAGLWSRLFGEGTPSFRRITQLQWDRWLQEFHRAPVPSGGVPGQRVAGLNLTEELLVRWSRRIRIKYLGVYDTVGAVGWDALAIPGIRSRLALHHNLRPTTLIQSCRHALAIDEHRSSFQHTPFVAYMGGHASEGERQRVADDGAVDDAEVEASWSRRIEQRWFVGAHSNIGGGYESNRLAEKPLRWLYEGATRAGLVAETIPEVELTAPLPEPRDSFAEFARPLWTWVIRAKRNYRAIDPDPELRADRHESGGQGEPRPGFSLVSINEQVDPSVLAYWSGRQNPPPNLVRYASGTTDGDAGLRALAMAPAPHPWIGNGYVEHLVLLLWATGAAAGVVASDRLFQLWRPNLPPDWWLATVAAAFAVVDWGESAGSFWFAKGRATPARRAFLDSIYWTRALGVALFVCGSVFAAVHLTALGWAAPSLAAARATSSAVAWQWGRIAVSAGIGVAAGNALNRVFAHAPAGRLKPTIAALVGGPVVVAGASAIVILLAYVLGRTAVLGLGLASSVGVAASASGEPERVAGLLLLLQLGFAYFLKAFSWVGEPMQKANLGPIVPLQLCWSPSRVSACLGRWRDGLGAPQHRPRAEAAMAAIVREALWRDIWGFIPVYAVVLGFGLWYGAHVLRCAWLAERVWHVPVWLGLPLVSAAADYVEDICHLRYLTLHANGKKPAALLVALSFLMSLVKFAAFITALALVVVVMLDAAFHLGTHPTDIGWRGLVALSVSAVAVIAVVGIGIWALAYPMFRPSPRSA